MQLRCELDDADRACPQCGDRLEPLAGQFETSEMIDVVEVKYQVVQVERQKYVCGCGSAVETAAGPERAIAGGRYSLRFALKVAYDKYVAHLPLERQARLMAHAGLEVTSQTLWDQCWAATRLLEPTYDAIFKLLRAGPVVGVDQTGWPDLEDKSLPPWQMWCVTAPGLVYHRICDDKSAATFTSLLGDYHGWVVADALGTHEAGAKHCRGVKLAACWAHVLRRFRDAVADHPEAQIMLAWIQDLYRIDQKATEPRRTRPAAEHRVPGGARQDARVAAGAATSEEHDHRRCGEVHASTMGAADRLRSGSGCVAGQQPDRTCAARSGQSVAGTTSAPSRCVEPRWPRSSTASSRRRRSAASIRSRTYWRSPRARVGPRVRPCSRPTSTPQPLRPEWANRCARDPCCSHPGLRRGDTTGRSRRWRHPGWGGHRQLA